MMVAIVHPDLKCLACVDVEIDYLMLVEHFEFAAWEALLAT
jgi:hypothetical protein